MSSLLTTTETATALGITPRRVLALIASGRLPATKVGRDWIISFRDFTKVSSRKPGRPRKD